MRAALAVTLVFLTVGCGVNENITTPSPSAEPTQVVVEQTVIGNGFYIEGARSYVRVLSPDGDVVVSKDTFLKEKVSFRLEVLPGEYVLESYQRPCGGNCGNLDPPMDGCETKLTVGENTEHALVRVSPSKGCTIELDPA